MTKPEPPRIEESYQFPPEVLAGTVDWNDIDPEVVALSRAEAEAEIDELWGIDKLEEARGSRNFPDVQREWGEANVSLLFEEGLDEPPPSVFYREDGKALLYRGKVSSIAGEPESAKGWFACAAAAEMVRRHESVVYIDFEDSAKGILHRMRTLGLTDEQILARFHVINPSTALGDPLDAQNNAKGRIRWERFRVVLRQAVGEDFESIGLGLVVFDGITQALANESLNPNANEDVAQWFATVPRRVADMNVGVLDGPAVLLVDHVVKATPGGRYAIGAGTKLAALDGAQFKASVEQSFGRGKQGFIRIGLTKDRPGHLRGIAVGKATDQVIAEMQLDSIDNGKRVTVSLNVPDENKAQTPDAKLAVMKDAMLVHIRESRQDVNKTSVYAAVTGKQEIKQKALDQLINDQLVVKRGKGWVVNGSAK